MILNQIFEHAVWVMDLLTNLRYENLHPKKLTTNYISKSEPHKEIPQNVALHLFSKNFGRT